MALARGESAPTGIEKGSNPKARPQLAGAPGAKRGRTGPPAYAFIRLEKLHGEPLAITYSLMAYLKLVPAASWGIDLDGIPDFSAGSVTDPSGVLSGARRVVRGGSWGNLRGYCRSAVRSFLTPVYGDEYHGFRVALSSVVNK